jgi:hypothetical protein
MIMAVHNDDISLYLFVSSKNTTISNQERFAAGFCHQGPVSLNIVDL